METSLDDIAGCGEIGCGHSGNGTSCEKLNDSEFVGWGLAKEAGFEVGVGWEVDSREWYYKQDELDLHINHSGRGGMKLTIPKQAGTCTLVKSHKTQVPHNPHCRAARGGISSFSNFTLHLETDFDDFKRVCEYLFTAIRLWMYNLPKKVKIRTT